MKNTEKGCEEERILVRKHSTETEAKAEKPQSLPARLLQKKKTVAFGRTVNVSQTIEVFLKFQTFNFSGIYSKSYFSLILE